MSLCSLSPSVLSFRSHLPDHRRAEKETTAGWSPEGQGAGLATLLAEDLSSHKEKTLSWVGPRAATVVLAPGPGSGPHSLCQGRVVGQGLEDRRAGQLTRLCAEAGTWTTVLTQLTWVMYWPLGNRGSPGHPGGRGGVGTSVPGSPHPLARVWGHWAGLLGAACQAG